MATNTNLSPSEDNSSGTDLSNIHTEDEEQIDTTDWMPAKCKKLQHMKEFHEEYQCVFGEKASICTIMKNRITHMNPLLLCKAIAILVLFCMSRVYMHFILFLHIAYTLLIFRFTSLCSLRQYSILCTSIDNRLNLLYIHLLFIHTIASLNMNALCYVTPYLYYSALISLNLSL